MNSIKWGIFAAALCAGAWSGGDAVAQRGFDLIANAYLDSTRVTVTRMTVEVPFYNLIFLRKEGLFDARYEVHLTVLPLDSDAPASTFVLMGSATVMSYEETKKRDQRSRASRTILLEPGNYRVDATLHVRDTGRVMGQTVTLKVPDFLTSGIGFSTPRVLVAASTGAEPLMRWADFVNERTEQLAETDPALVAFDYQPAIRFSIFLDSVVTDPIPCDVYYELVDNRDEQVLYGKRKVQITGNKDEYILALNVDQLEPGTYQVNLRASTGLKRNVATTSTKIHVDVTRSMLDARFDQTLEVLSLIASKEELQPLKDAAPEDRAEQWSAFWKRRDPDPSTVENEDLVEYMRRINYVARNFSKVGDGWRTDRGRVYIRFGEPDEVSTSTDAQNRGEYLIWQYYVVNRSFVFYDMFGLGDYRLVEGEIF